MSGEGAPRFWFKVCTEAGSCFWSSETLHFAPRSVLKPFTVPSALPAPHKILFHEVGIYAPRSSASPSRLLEATSSPSSWDSGERAPLLRPTPSQWPCLLGPCLHNDLSPDPVLGWVTWASHLTPVVLPCQIPENLALAEGGLLQPPFPEIVGVGWGVVSLEAKTSTSREIEN